jgi:hypothetical protein
MSPKRSSSSARRVVLCISTPLRSLWTRPASRRILKCWERVALGKVLLTSLRTSEQVRALQQFLSNQSVQNLHHSGDPAGALQQAYRMLQASIQTNSFVMAYSECFLAIGVILITGSVMIWLCAKAKAGGAAAAH